MGKLKILGSGTSTGVPEVGCTCPVCVSTDPRDNRLRASSLIDTGDALILIDCGPDFREQMIDLPFRQIDGVLITHEHYDHVGGLDDLRPFCRFGEVTVFAENTTAYGLRTRMPYCFSEHKYPGVPAIELNEVEVGQPFLINHTEILPLRVMHGRLPILGYRIGRMAYITDMLTMPDESFDQLHGLDLLVVNALRIESHMTHQTLDQAIETARRVGACETYFIHMSHHMGLHATVEKLLPAHVHFAYDGEEITF
nr:MBL fold metallo-hydrolase [uncultured Bacteroides sp.]